MRIAISAVQFSNDRPIGAKRPRALAQILAEHGHEVTVFTPATEPHETAPVPAGITVRELMPYPWSSPVRKRASLWRRALMYALVAGTTPRVVVLSRPALARLFGMDEDRRAAAFDAINTRRRLTMERVGSVLDARRWSAQSAASLTADEASGFDAILSTTPPIGSLFFGRFLARRNPRAVWVSDIRDAMVVPGMLSTGRAILAAQERRAIREASAITVVSEGVKHSILQQRVNRPHADRITVLPNGFMPRTVTDAAESHTPGPLRIGYTGQIYAEGRDATPLFRAIHALLGEHAEAQIEVHYAGNQGHRMIEFAAAFGLERLVIDHGLMSHADAVALQDGMDLLLVLSWNRKNSQGIISGKFGEYLASEKPILALVGGDVPHAELTILVRKMNVGHAYEESGSAEGHEELIAFLRHAVALRASGRPLDYEPVAAERADFDYETIARRFESLMEMADSPHVAVR